MPNVFKAEVFQNPYLPSGTNDVHAIMTVTAGEATRTGGGGRIFGILCDVSGSMEGGKISAARAAIVKLIELLPPDCHFFVVAGADTAQLTVPVVPAISENKTRAIRAVQSIHAVGGTTISVWLKLALEQFQTMPNALRQAILLTDGQNEPEDNMPLEAALRECEGRFQCDCRGVGTDWRVPQLRAIADKLLGTTDIIPAPAQMQADFESILQKAMAKTVNDVFLRLWTPVGAQVKFCKTVSPEIVDLGPRARQTKPQVREYPTGAWGKAEARDYHFCISVAAGAVGDEVLAGRAGLVCVENGVENKIAEVRILAIWTDDEAKSAKIDRVVAHYTGQADLAQSIQEGMEARNRGDSERATALLGKAVKIAYDSGNEATAKLLRNVVDIEDAEKGTVRLKGGVTKESEMMLETRSTKTARIKKGE